MKIAILADPFIPIPPEGYGGIERIIAFLATGLKGRGHDVILTAHASSALPVKMLNYRNSDNNLAGIISNIATVSGLRNFKPDVIHSFGRLAYLLPFLRFSIPKIMSYQREPTVKQISRAVKISKPNTLSFTGCSNYISNTIKPYAPVDTVYNGVDLNSYDFQYNSNSDAPLIFLGRLEPIKGVHTAIDVAIKTNKKLIIAGNIPAGHETYFQERILPYLNSKIIYAGPVNDSQKNELLGRALALLMPIEWNEPFGIVMAEAMACGTPVIGFNKGSVPEIINHGVNGFICNTTKDMMDAVDMIKEIDRKNVRKECEERFSAEKIIDQYINIYKARLSLVV